MLKLSLTIIMVLFTVRSLFAIDAEKTVNNELILLTVDKKQLKAYLRTLPSVHSQSKLLQSFRIAIGKEEGDKFKEGDNKTPEGIYFPAQHIDTDKINPGKYGKSAISLNFPNLMDKIDGKTGYGIWLHGAGDDSRIANRQVTEGCVAFYNSDILKLTKWIQPGHSVIAIATDYRDINREEDFTAVSLATQSWINSWQNRDIESYISFYDENFSGKGLNKHQYRNYKKNVFKSYKNMVIAMNNVRVVTHPKYSVSLMHQEFSGDKRFLSRGRKILYWQKAQSGEWKIIRESFDRENFAPLSYTSLDILALQEMAQHEKAHAHGTELSPEQTVSGTSQSSSDCCASF